MGDIFIPKWFLRLSDSGSSLIGMDAELEEEEVDECENSMVDRALQKPVVQNEAEAIVDSAPLATPLPFGRYNLWTDIVVYYIVYQSINICTWKPILHLSVSSF